MNLQELTRIYDLTGNTFFVTGGTGVLCGAIARALNGCGANIALLARSEEKGRRFAESAANPGRVMVVPGDVLDTASLNNAADQVMARFGRIDGLINGAGGNSPGATTSADLSFFDLPADALRQVFDLNFSGTLGPCQVFGKIMARQGEGVILNISSMAAIRPLTRVVGYAAAKSAINSLTEWLAVYMARECSPRIRVNAIAPGFFMGAQNRQMLVEPTGKLTARGQSIIDHTPMGRFGEPEDLLGAALWLMSPASSFVTGIVVPVDGGFSVFAGV
jgi:NAD(P)-dependent dehydrogenase (short-subunit alcohol dehydrogenase family)